MKLRFSRYEGLRFRRTSHYVRNIQFSLYLLGIALFVGVVGLIVIERYSFIDAFYMTIITLSTVGFGEIQELSEAGRIFISFMIIFNLGIFAYAISNISVFILEGDLRKLLKDYRVYNQIKELKGHVVLCGAGKHGHEVIENLQKQHLPFVVIESNHKKIEDLREEYKNLLYIEGDATHDEILEEAGIKNASALIVTIGADAENVYVVLSARQINPDLRIISRAMDKKSEHKLIRAGADYVVMPERIGGFYMATLVNKPDAVEFFTLLSNMGDTQIVFEEISNEQLMTKHRNKTIRELNIRGITGANVIGIHDEKGNYIINPGPDTLIRPNMRLVILGDKKQVSAFRLAMMK